MHRRIFLACAMLAATFAAANAQTRTIEVQDPWARATLGQARTGAAYLTLTATGPAADRLVSASSPVAAKTELHNHIMVGNVAQMRPVDAIEVAPGSPTLLQPGGLHIMLIDIKAPLQAGTSFPVTLTFEKAGPIIVQVAVRAIRAPAAHGHTN
ncbi:MAG: copper chaperone PCu(A)C [Telmatospirillum sp.]|nr:copper chaperone PCu(A)C [Telmatospirillum sp.]